MDESEKEAFEEVITNKTNLNFEEIKTRLLPAATTENSNVKSKVQAHIATLSADGNLFSPTDYYIFENDSYTLGSRIWNYFVTKRALLRAVVYFGVLSDKSSQYSLESITELKRDLLHPLLSDPELLLRKTVELANNFKETILQVEELKNNDLVTSALVTFFEHWETVVALFLVEDGKITPHDIKFLQKDGGVVVSLVNLKILADSSSNNEHFAGNEIMALFAQILARHKDDDYTKNVNGLHDVVKYTLSLLFLKSSLLRKVHDIEEITEAGTIFKRTSLYVAEEELNKCDFYTTNGGSLFTNPDESKAYVHKSIQQVQQFHVLKQWMQNDSSKHERLQERMALRFKMNERQNSLVLKNNIRTVSFEFDADTEKEEESVEYPTVPPETFLSELSMYDPETDPGNHENNSSKWSEIVTMRKNFTEFTGYNRDFGKFREDVASIVRMSQDPESLSFPFQEPIVWNTFVKNVELLLPRADDTNASRELLKLNELQTIFAEEEKKYRGEKVVPFVKWKNYVNALLDPDSGSDSDLDLDSDSDQTPDQ